MSALLLIGLAASSTAAGALDAEIGLDLLRASSIAEPPGAGTPETMGAQELGMRVRFHAEERRARLSLDVDYHGREPVGGEVEDTALRKLYRAELRFTAIEDRLELGLGRFIAPSPGFLVVDGASATLRFGPFTLAPYGGRRAISSTLRNLPFDAPLPALGASLMFAMDAVLVELLGGYAEDTAVLTKGSAGEAQASFGAASASLRASARLLDDALRLGAELGIAERADYVIGPAWSAIALEVRAFDLASARAYLEWRPLELLRLRYAFAAQQAAMVSGLGPELTASVQDRGFGDHAVRGSARVLELGWAHADLGLRVRSDRLELRGGASVDLDRLVALGPVTLGARGQLTHEAVSFDDPTGKPDLDRTLWSLALSASWEALEAEAGVSFIHRSAAPISSRVFDPSSSARPDGPEDFAPFVLEAQRFAFLRAFYGTELWFAGIDVEENLSDPSEQRFFVQLGARWGTTW